MEEQMNIWDHYCISFPSLAVFPKPRIVREYGKRTLYFQKRDVLFRLVVDLFPCMRGERKVPCYYYFNMKGQISERKRGDLSDGSFALVIYETLEKYF